MFDSLPQEVQDALGAAGVADLPAGPRAWLAARLEAAGYDPATHCIAGLRPAHPGGGTEARRAFPSVAAAAAAAVAVARRAGAAPGAPAPDLSPVQWPPIPPQPLDANGVEVVAVAGGGGGGPYTGPIDAIVPAFNEASTVGATEVHEQTDVGWIPFFGPSGQASATYALLRADWDAFGPAIAAGGPALAYLAPDVAAWNDFADRWEASDSVFSWVNPIVPGLPMPSQQIAPQNLGAELDAEVMRANRVRASLCQAAALPADQCGAGLVRRGVDATEASAADRFAAQVDAWAKGHPLLNWLTSPKQSPTEAGERIVGTVVVSLAAAATGLALLHGYAGRSRTTVEVNLRRPAEVST